MHFLKTILRTTIISSVLTGAGMAQDTAAPATGEKPTAGQVSATPIAPADAPAAAGDKAPTAPDPKGDAAAATQPDEKKESASRAPRRFVLLTFTVLSGVMAMILVIRSTRKKQD